jgi:hypothetical protein
VDRGRRTVPHMRAAIDGLSDEGADASALAGTDTQTPHTTLVAICSAWPGFFRSSWCNLRA